MHANLIFKKYPQSTFLFIRVLYIQFIKVDKEYS